MPALQKEMQASSTSNFRYFTCLLDKGHIISHLLRVVFLSWNAVFTREKTLCYTDKQGLGQK